MEKRHNHKIGEKDSQKQWLTEQTYSMEHNEGPLYSIDTPPPTVSGTLHIGHIFSYTQTDIIARYKRMVGYCVFYPFGFDDNGLPTERYVEKIRKIKAHQLSRSEFIKICLEETKKAEKNFISLWQQMGLSVDWNYCYSTISNNTRKISQTSFIDLFEKGYIYRQTEPALYCTTCRTTVAQAELNDQETESFFNDIVFKDEQGNDLIIGTTRPELLASCVAVFFNPTDERYKHLKNKKARVPIFDFEVPILEDEAVDIEKGTGLVMCCTFGDKTDIAWYKKFKLPYKQAIGPDGTMQKNAGLLAGLKSTEARTKIIQELFAQNLLIRQKEISHNVNVHERCKKEIEFILLPQWFINILDHKKKFLELAEQINWFPSFMKSRYINWVENLSWDWCISRQRFYGIPFPVWHCQDCNAILLADKNQLPVDPQETPYKYTHCPKCNGTTIVPDTDVMDTWNTSSLTPYICYSLFANTSKPFEDKQIRNFIPMGMRPQAHDIIRTWAFYTIVKTWMHNNGAPWKDIIISGHVLSNQKEKLSKSKGQKTLSPEHLLEQYPADVIRFWTASGTLGHDISFSENQFKIGQRLVTKIWNAFRFAYQHLETFHTPEQLPDEFGVVNEWILDTITKTFTSYQNYFENNEFSLALNHIEHFFWNDFCDNYLELIKHQLFNPDKYSEKEVYATKWTLYTIGLRILQFYAPYLPYVTETIYGTIYRGHQDVPSIHQTKFQHIQQAYIFEDNSVLVQNIIELIGQVRRLKTEQQLSLKVPIELLALYFQEKTLADRIKQHEQLIRGITHANEIKYHIGSSKPELKETKGLWHATISL